ncbi:hypothetical protein AGABI1DRAFT_118307 [Agaricus bisporus var. burnettii JB137-S8]|uniref:tRNA dimethylallyltransferase n=1 Tax=Agaricus bisporus var. burnettii (strain JB137-S8 / ATCC MYA-4627 / FGSC 10392) TaxID=597362 RepID=K5XHE3_AGABU|nr:uncharacterized protein AGABI1DRAFT_118307 [Agaricus bisporus var. burnettii JB137-S8]EKM82878.1 hypothetical protein AGABI1DRAFT_118307 [Agaricus bisporus var. burnettii JB137-S8]
MTLRPLIAICGTTGVGKSNIAVELALRIQQGGFKNGWRGAKIINADSMQVYEGLNVITNKIPQEERMGVEHLLMDFKKPGEQYVVGQWVHDAIGLASNINKIHEDGEVPIVVGGTSYWIQHLVFPDRLMNKPSTTYKQSQGTKELEGLVNDPELLQLFHSLPVSAPPAGENLDEAFKMHSLLAVLDPVTAARWHWRDTRKVLRSLEIIKETGRKASDIVAEQSSRTAFNKPRFRTLFFWLYAEPSVLEKRLYDRVDTMLALGLLDEIRSLRKIASESLENDPLADGKPDYDYSLGIYQAIGYKEFHDYLSRPESTQQDFSQAVDRMKLSTRQYAKRQISWIRNKLIPAISASAKEGSPLSLYLLDATELDKQWEINVREPAINITTTFLEGRSLPEAKSLSLRAREMLIVQEKDIRYVTQYSSAMITWY